MQPLYIFDLDGTLAIIDHRRHLAEAGKWDEFYMACVDDKPNQNIICIMTKLYDSLCDIKIWSGRSDLARKETIEWLENHIYFIENYHDTDDDGCELLDGMIKMRQHGDYTPDEELKRQWYDALPSEDKERLVCVFDDRQKVVNMWRSIGVTCLQVAPGDF